MKLLTKALKFLFSGSLNLIASLASIIGLLIVAFSEKNKALIALISIIVFLIIILIKLFFVAKTFILQKTAHGYHKFATYVRYSTDDGLHLIYEVHKYLQCKTVVMDEYVHEFYWSGTCEPKITSLLQDYQEFVKTPKGEYDKAIFRFKRPLGYNEFCILHVRMDLDDDDGRSKPFCEQVIKEPLQLLSFRVELRHLDNNPDAKISKRRINAQLMQEDDIIEYIKFDKQSKSYETNIFNPEVGYSYRIEWQKR